MYIFAGRGIKRGCTVVGYPPTVKTTTATDVKERTLTSTPLSTLTTRRSQCAGARTAALRWGHGDVTTATTHLLAACTALDLERRALTHGLDLTDGEVLDQVLTAARAEIAAAHA